MRRVGPVSMFSTEPVIMGLIGGMYLIAGWYLHASQGKYAGEAQGTFQVLLYVDSAVYLLSAYVAAATAFGGYGELGSDDDVVDQTE
jgi:hypothetical protein